MDSIQRLLGYATGDGCWSTGAQVSYAVDDAPIRSVVAGVDGLGRPVVEATKFAVYCAAKPLTALAVAVLVDAGELSLDDRVGDILTDESLRDVPTLVSDLLTHRTGLWKYPALNFLTLNEATRRAHLAEALRREPQETSSAYAEFVGWELLRYVVETLSGTPLYQFIQEAILAPANLLDSICVSPKLLLEQQDELGVNVTMLDGRPLPMLWERSTDNLADSTATTGAYATSAGLARLYQTIFLTMTGRGPWTIDPVLTRQFVTAAGLASYDPVLRRESSYGYGFMITPTPDLESLHPSTFGHTGMNGMTLAGCDPTTGLCFAMHTNAVTEQDEPDNPARSAIARRRDILNILAKFPGTIEPSDTKEPN